MSSLPYQFKISKPGDSTRKLSFDENPSWIELTAKIDELFGIPPEHIALVYEDVEGDKVTMSTEEELTEYYATAQLPYKFTVKDLTEASHAGDSVHDHNSRLGDNDRPSRAHSRAGANRSPFTGPFDLGGIPLTFDIIDHNELSGLPADLFLMSGVPHHRPQSAAFVEEVEASRKGSPPRSVHSAAPPQNKGKGRAPQSKQPSVVEVPDTANAADAASISSDDSLRDTFANNKTPVPAVDTKLGNTAPVEPKAKAEEPKSLVQQIIEFGRRQREREAAAAAAGETAVSPTEDPPLAPLESAKELPPPPQPSLVADIGELTQQIAAAVAAHPEVGENIRSVLRNVASGTYWANTSGQLPNESEDAQAGMRLADAIGDLFKTVAGTAGAEVAKHAIDAVVAPRPAPAATPSAQNAANAGPGGPRGNGWARVRERMFPNGPPPPPPFGRYGPPPPFDRYGYGGPPPPPLPPPPPSGAPRYAGPPPMPPSIRGRFDPFDPRNIARLRQAQYAPPPGPPPPPAPPAAPAAPAREPAYVPPPPPPPPRGPYLPPPPPPPNSSAVVPVSTAVVAAPAPPVAPVDRRAALEAAKQAYIEQKEAYRQEKEERRREKERLARERSGFAAIPASTTTAATSNNYGTATRPETIPEQDEESTNASYTPKAASSAAMVPTVELESDHLLNTPVPPKQQIPLVPPPPLVPVHTYPPPKSVADESDIGTIRTKSTVLTQAPADVKPESTFAKMAWMYRPVMSPPQFGLFGTSEDVAVRVGRRLNEVGFNDATHPDLQRRIARQLRNHVDPTKDAEDAIVTRLIEELLSVQATASTTKNMMPGAFE